MSEEDTKRCPYCAETIKKEAIVCRYCGKDLATAAQSTPSPSLNSSSAPVAKAQSNQKKPKKKKTIFIVLLIAGILVVLCCIGGALLSGNEEIGKVDGTSIMDLAEQTLDAEQNLDSEPASTKTSKPNPTMTPTVVAAPSLSEILDTIEGMTDAQREHYYDTLKGNHVESWQGTVTEVDQGEIFGFYIVMVEMDSSNIGSDVYFPVEEDVALTLNLNEKITFSGTIDYVTDFIGHSVHLEDVVIE